MNHCKLLQNFKPQINRRRLSLSSNVKVEKPLINKSVMDGIPLSHVRNFSIVAHIDHGKSTLADRLLELTGTINKLNKKEAQVLDTLQVTKWVLTDIGWKGSRNYNSSSDGIYDLYWSKTKEKYLLNLIDTPGHVDFSY